MSRANQIRLIRTAREVGFTDADILREVLRGVYGGEKRRRLVVEWGELLGGTPSDALRIAHEAGLIPSAHPPRDAR
jgi:hypothetical protein